MYANIGSLLIPASAFTLLNGSAFPGLDYWDQLTGGGVPGQPSALRPSTGYGRPLALRSLPKAGGSVPFFYPTNVAAPVNPPLVAVSPNQLDWGAFVDAVVPAYLGTFEPDQAVALGPFSVTATFPQCPASIGVPLVKLVLPLAPLALLHPEYQANGFIANLGVVSTFATDLDPSSDTGTIQPVISAPANIGSLIIFATRLWRPDGSLTGQAIGSAYAPNAGSLYSFGDAIWPPFEGKVLPKITELLDPFDPTDTMESVYPATQTKGVAFGSDYLILEVGIRACSTTVAASATVIVTFPRGAWNFINYASYVPFAWADDRTKTIAAPYVVEQGAPGGELWRVSMTDTNPSAFIAGQVRGLAAGAVGFPSQVLTQGVVITAYSKNSGPVTLGASGATPVFDGTGNSKVLEPGEAVGAAVANLSALYLASPVDGRFVTYLGS